MSSRLVKCVVSVCLGFATAAWPCSGGPCVSNERLPTFDGGGLPSNLLPPVLTGLWSAAAFPSDGARLLSLDGGSSDLTTHAVDPLSVALEGTFVQGSTYVIDRASGCSGVPQRVTQQITVLPPIALPTGGVVPQLGTAGMGPVAQYGGPACQLSAPAVFQRLTYGIDPAVAPLLPFYGWELSLVPLDGGAPLPWRTSEVGSLLADGSLREHPFGFLAPKTVLLVWHACRDDDGGLPPDLGAPRGTYRARLQAKLLGGDAGFVSETGAFELSCPGEGTEGGHSGHGDPDAGSSVARPEPGCSVAGQAWLGLALLWFANRRRSLR